MDNTRFGAALLSNPSNVGVSSYTNTECWHLADDLLLPNSTHIFQLACTGMLTSVVPLVIIHKQKKLFEPREHISISSPRITQGLIILPRNFATGLLLHMFLVHCLQSKQRWLKDIKECYHRLTVCIVQWCSLSQKALLLCNVIEKSPSDDNLHVALGSSRNCP